MSFLAVAHVFLKLPRLFLNICKWVLVRMALNCKISSPKSRLFGNSTNKLRKEQLRGSCGGFKWWRIALVFWFLGGFFGFVSVFHGFNRNGVSTRKEKVSDLWEEKARILQERFNVSKDQLDAIAHLFKESDQEASLECIKKSTLVAPSEGVKCEIEMLSSYRETFQMQQLSISDIVEGKDQCRARHKFILERPETSSAWKGHVRAVKSQEAESSLSNDHTCGMNVLQTRALGNKSKEHCGSLPFCSPKICWYVLATVMVSWMVSGFQGWFWIVLNRKLVQQQPQNQSSSKGGGKWRKKLLVLFLLSGLVGSAWLCWFMSKNTILWRRDLLANMCDERARMLQDQFNVSLNHVHALAILVSTFHHGKQPSAIDQKTFAEYTERTSFERPLTSGVAYALKVLHSEREQFEKVHGWTIKKMEEDDSSPVEDYIPEKLDPAPIQDEYAPVIFSQETVSHIVSIDMMSGKEDRDNILRARASGKGVLTSPFKLLKSNHLGVVLTFAVYNTNLPRNATPQQRIEATEGYLGASYDVPSLVEKLLHQLASKQTIVVNVYDTTDTSAPINMYGPQVIDTGLWHNSTLDFGDPVRRHEMHCRFKQKPPPPWTAIMASAGVFVITLLVAHIFHAAINRIAKVEGDYCEMMELKVRAEAADVAKSQFLATVSHEIRTPMNGVLGMLQMLMDTDLNANQLDYALTAHTSGKDLISLINEVLDQAKIESGRLELEAVQFDLRAVLDNVLSLFSGKSHDKGIELAVYISDLVPEVVTGDPVRFRQIITNLVGNSVKFTEKGHVFVSVHLADEVSCPLEVKDNMLKQQMEMMKNGVDRPYNTLSGFLVVNRWKSWETFKMISSVCSAEATEMVRLLVTVEDTGVGIPTDAQKHIFMPFMQADSSTSRTYGGTGIGLSISKCLVGMMGGEIGFESEPGTGSSFSFAVALTKSRVGSPEMKRHQFVPPVSEFSGLRGLLVDGRSVRAEVTRYHLKRLGISVDVAISLESMSLSLSNACTTSGRIGLDMVLIDKDGWNEETTRALCGLLKEARFSMRQKLFEKRPKWFLVATSGSIEIDEFKTSGLVDDIIMKPLRLSMLVTCFHQAFGTATKKDQNKEKPSFLQSLLKGKKILVVDDNIVNRRVAAAALKKYGAQVTCVDSGKASIEMLRPPHDFDACFMDLQMPEMDGFEATRQVRCIENKMNEQIKTEKSNEIFDNLVQWHTPILAMTADVIQATHEKCLKCGMDGYVSKPFEEEQLYSAVMQFFESDQ